MLEIIEDKLIKALTLNDKKNKAHFSKKPNSQFTCLNNQA